MHGSGTTGSGLGSDVNPKSMRALDHSSELLPQPPSGHFSDLSQGPERNRTVGSILPPQPIHFRGTASLPSRGLMEPSSCVGLRLLTEFPIYTSLSPCKGGTIIIPILKMRKWGLREGHDLPRVTQIRYKRTTGTHGCLQNQGSFHHLSWDSDPRPRL